MGSERAVLEGIRVLDFGRYLAGPFCAALLGDFGAEVIRIDKVGGSEDRQVMPIAADGSGALFMQVNRNKRSLTLDPTSPPGREVLARLVATSDVVVANMPMRNLTALGLDYDALVRIRPDIILTTATAFGSGGPDSERVGFDGVAQAASGAIYLSGLPAQPVKPNVPYVDYGTGLACAFGTLAALMARQTTGRGQIVEGSLLATGFTFLSAMLIEQAVTGVDRGRTGNRNPVAGPSDVFATSDGWIIAQVIGAPLFRRWTQLVGREELVQDPRYADDGLRGMNGAALSTIMAEWCAPLSTAEALARLAAVRIPAGPVNSPRQALEDPHVGAVGLLHRVEYPGISGTFPLIDTLVRLSATPAGIRRRPPVSGEHTAEILSELGYAAAELNELRAAGVV